MDDQDVRKRRLYRLLFGVYCLGMALLLFHRPVYSLEEREYWQILTENQNLIPFRTIRVCLELLHAEEAWLRRYATVNFTEISCCFCPGGCCCPGFGGLWKAIGGFCSSASGSFSRWRRRSFSPCGAAATLTM